MATSSKTIDHIPDDVLHNILARLPPKPLARFSCASKHCNHLVSDPYFTKLISRRMTLLSFQPLLAIDDNIPVDDPARSLVELDCPYGDLKGTKVSIVGTFNGIVLLLLGYISCKDTCAHAHKLVLYNPFTGESKMLPEPPSPYRFASYAFGFGQGTTSDELRIVRLRNTDYGYLNCDVFDFQTSLWDSFDHVHIQGVKFGKNSMGTYLNGFLYWIASKSKNNVIVALNVNEIRAYSDIHIPDECSSNDASTHLGTMNGCLCILNKVDDVGFDVWVMKEQGVENSLYKAHSFALRLEGNVFKYLFPIAILDSGNIIVTDERCQLVIYNIAKASHKLINVSNRFNYTKIHGVEYVESLVSISKLCLV